MLVTVSVLAYAMIKTAAPSLSTFRERLWNGVEMFVFEAVALSLESRLLVHLLIACKGFITFGRTLVSLLAF